MVNPAEDSGWSDVSTLTCQTLEQVELTVMHATLEASRTATLGACTTEQACAVMLHLGSAKAFDLYGRRGLLWSGRVEPGFVTVTPGPEAVSVKTSHRLEVLVLRIPNLSLLRLAGESRPRLEHTGETTTHDQVGHELGLALLSAFRVSADVRPPSTAHWVRAIGYHFAFKHAWALAKSLESGGLSPWQMRTAEDLLSRGDLQIREVAAACQLSPRHFSRLFRSTFRCSSQTFRLERRVDAMKTLLLSTDISLAEAAARIGFADQASMSRAFRQVVGTSPGAWRASQRRSSNELPAAP